MKKLIGVACDKFVLGAAAMSLPFAPANAAELVHKWKFSGTPGNCIMTASFSDKTSILIGHIGDETRENYFVHALNPAWKSTPVKTAAGAIIFDGRLTLQSSKATIRRAKKNSLFHTLIFTDRSTILNPLARAGNMSVRFDDAQHGNYPLTGLNTILADFKKCTRPDSADAGPQETPPPAAIPPKEPKAPNITIIRDHIVTPNQRRDINMLILNDSQSWFRNAYIFNSVYKADVIKKTDNNNYVIRAWYLFNRSRKGYVDVEIVSGRYSCLRFWDFPANCKKARTEQL